MMHQGLDSESPLWGRENKVFISLNVKEAVKWSLSITAYFTVQTASIKKKSRKDVPGKQVLSHLKWSFCFTRPLHTHSLGDREGQVVVSGSRAQAIESDSQASLPSKTNEILSWSVTFLTHTIGMMTSRAAYLTLKHRCSSFFLLLFPSFFFFFFFSNQFQCTDVIGRL